MMNFKYHHKEQKDIYGCIPSFIMYSFMCKMLLIYQRLSVNDMEIKFYFKTKIGLSLHVFFLE